MFRRKAKPLCNTPPGIWCPACGSNSLKTIHEGRWETRYSCGSCGCPFEVDTDMDLEDYKVESNEEGASVRILWRESPSPLAIVREIVIGNDPSIGTIARNDRVFAWICGYWSFISWNEHGNDIGYHELAYDGGFRDILDQLVYDPGALEDYIRYDMEDDELDNDQRRLISELHKLTSVLERR